MIPPALFFFLKTVLAIQGFLYFHINLKLFVLSDISHIEKDKFCMLSLIFGI